MPFQQFRMNYFGKSTLCENRQFCPSRKVKFTFHDTLQLKTTKREKRLHQKKCRRSAATFQYVFFFLTLDERHIHNAGCAFHFNEVTTGFKHVNLNFSAGSVGVIARQYQSALHVANYPLIKSGF